MSGYPFQTMVSPELIEALCRLLDPDPTIYAGLKLAGDKDQCERFATDVALVADKLAEIIHLPIKQFLDES